MTVELFIFYLLATVTVASGVMVISARNPVHSVLFLILAFFNSAGLFILIGAEFLAMILVVVYVGAVAVLFMFVVMMLDINFLRLQEGFMQFLPVGLLVGLVLLAELVLVGGTWVARGSAIVAVPPDGAVTVSNTAAIGNLLYTQYFYLFQTAGMILLVELVLVGGTWVARDAAIVLPAAGTGVSNTEAIGRLLYTEYFYLFQTAGMILLVAIIGAITLTLRHRPVRRQDIGRQVNRVRAETIELRKVRSGSGI